VGGALKRRRRSSTCPECGGDLLYMPSIKRYVCQSCGVMYTHQELMEEWRKLREELGLIREEEEDRRREYLKWWLKSKKEK